MPGWAWVTLIGVVGLLVVAAVLGATHEPIVRWTRKPPADPPLHGDPADFTAPVPIHLTEDAPMTERELDAERDAEAARDDAARRA